MAIPTWSRRLSAPTDSWLSKHESNSSNSSNSGEIVESLGAVLDYLQNSQDEALSAAQRITTAKVFKALADVCRDPTARQRISEGTALAQTVSATLERVCRDLGAAARDREEEEEEEEEKEEGEQRAEQVFLLVQVLRCICNLAADNDGAREQIAEARGVQAIARTLSTVDEVRRQPVPVGQAAFAAALNVSLDNARCTAALVGGGALQPHLRALAADSPTAAEIAIWPLVSSSLDNLCESDAATQQFEKHADYARTVLRALARMARTLSDAPAAAGEEATAAVRGAQRTLLWILCETLEKSATVRQQLCTPEAVLALFSVLEFYLLGSGAEEEEAEEEDDGDRGNRPLPPNRPLPQAANRRADAVTQAIVGISGEDAALETLFADASLQARLLGILTADRDSSGDAQRVDAMAATAALCLGNLARTDAHCTQLVEQHPAIVRTLIHEWFAPSVTSSSSGANAGAGVSAGVSVRTRHAASGLLKNLCLAAANRPVLVRFGLVRVAARCIDTAVIPIQANAIGILRHLIGGSGSSSAAEAVLGLLEEIPAARDGASKTRALADLLKAVASTDVDGIRCEGTRLVAAVAKKVYLPAERQDGAAAPALAQAREILEERRLDIVSPLVRLVLLDGRRHPLLQQESLVALTVLAATDPHRSRHVADIVRLLAAEEEKQKKEDGDENDDDGAPATFGQALESILTQNGAVWPQTTLQAKSLVSHLRTIVDSSINNGDDNNGSAAFDASGLAVLQTTLAPLST